VDLGSFHNEDELLIVLMTGWPSCWSGRSWHKKRLVATAVKTGRFSRRLQLGPSRRLAGAPPPVSTLFNCRADLVKSPGPCAIYLTLRGNAVSLCVASGP